MAMNFLRWHSTNPVHPVTYSTATNKISIIASPLNKRTFEEEESQNSSPCQVGLIWSRSSRSRHDVPATKNQNDQSGVSAGSAQPWRLEAEMAAVAPSPWRVSLPRRIVDAQKHKPVYNKYVCSNLTFF